MRILVVEDEKKTAAFVRKGLAAEGFAVDVIHDGEATPTVLRVADLALDTVTHEARRGGRAIQLTAREYRLLEFLMHAPGRICGRMLLLEKVWDYGFDPGTNLVDVYIMRLREKIDEGQECKLLHTVRGAGYTLKEPS